MGCHRCISEFTSELLILVDQRWFYFVPGNLSLLRVAVQQAKEIIHLLLAQICMQLKENLTRNSHKEIGQVVKKVKTGRSGRLLP